MDLTQLNILLYKQPAVANFSLPLQTVGALPIVQSENAAQVMLYVMASSGPTKDELYTIQQAAKKMPVVIGIYDVDGAVDVEMTLPHNVTLANADDPRLLEDALFDAYLRVVRAYYRARVMAKAKKALVSYKSDIEKIWRTKQARAQAESLAHQFLQQDLKPILHDVAKQTLEPLSPSIAFFEDEAAQKITFELLTNNVSKFFQQLRSSEQPDEKTPGKLKTFFGNTSQKARALMNKSSFEVADAFEQYVLQALRTNQHVATLISQYIAQVKEALMPMHARETVNVAILGQTGVGKSSLINYLFNEPKRATGAGKPVTEQGFFEEKLMLNGVPVSLIDSWGIEQGKDDVWMADFKQFLQSRGYQAAVAEWVHIAIYCVSAASARVQDFDLQVIQMLRDQKIHVLVALTKASLVDEATIHALTETIEDATDGGVTIIPVNSVEQKLMTGETIARTGLDDITAQIRVNYLDMLNERLPDRVLYLARRKAAGEYRRRIHESLSSKEAVQLAKHLATQFTTHDLQALMTQEVHAAMRTYESTFELTRTTRRQMRKQPNDFHIEAFDKLEEAFRSTILMQSPPQVARKFQRDMEKYMTAHETRIIDETRQLIVQASNTINEE
ncbi:GTPase domain-containing protein [Kurthia massiliensis]|uniref:GTPase domain-containing protein n=1 Tax=Kurthia massiliensis TaxID=1033739 RepID=UPI0002899C4C|nr:GTPase domain-containing protein [Kurthia massiliensis]